MARIAKAFQPQDGEVVAPDKRGGIHTGSGALKSHWEPVRIRAVDRVVWFALGVPEMIAHVLRSIDWLGSKRRQGYGQVTGWDVEPVGDGVDRSWSAPCGDGSLILMRPMPVGVEPSSLGLGPFGRAKRLLGWRRGYAALCAPYWHPARHGAALVPTDHEEIESC